MALNMGQLAQQLQDPGIRTLIENLIKASPILGHAAVIPASHADVHKFKHWTALPDVASRTFGAGFTVSQPTKEVSQLDLHQLGVVHEEDARTVESSTYFNSMDFFDEYAPTYFAALGQGIATAIYTGGSDDDVTWNSLDYYATLYSNEVDAAGAGGSTDRTSIYVVKWDGNATGIVFNPSAVTDFSTMVRVQPQNVVNGVMTSRLKDNADSTKRPVYEVSYDTIFNLLSNSQFNIAKVKNVRDNATGYPTMQMLLEAIDMAKGTPGNTYIYTSRLGRRLIARLKDAKLQMMTTDTNYAVSTFAIDGIPVFADENIPENL